MMRDNRSRSGQKLSKFSFRRNMKRAAAACALTMIICILSALSFASLTVNAAEGSTDSAQTEQESSYDVIYDDSAGLITTEAEKEKVLAQMQSVSADCNVIFYTTDSRNYGYQTDEKCENYTAERYGTSKTAPVVMFIIDMDNREIYLYCTGDIRYIITSSEALTITDNIYRYASRGDYAGCAENAFSQVHSLATGLEIKRPMKRINNLLIALFLGFLLQYVLMMILRDRHRKQFTGNRLDAYGSKTISVHTDMELVRSYIYKESSGSGGDGGSGGGGGFSGGGGGSSGGGHSF